MVATAGHYRETENYLWNLVSIMSMFEKALSFALDLLLLATSSIV